MELLIASKNIGKIREIKAILENPDLSIISMNDIEIVIPPIQETGSNYFDNAFIKAKAVSKLTGKNTLADDSGIEIDYLHGEPGVKSARFPSPDNTDEHRCMHVLSLLDGVPEEQRNAKFVCVMVLYLNSGIVYSARGECTGKISKTPIGNHGFGYDPIFIPEGFDDTFAEIKPKIKNKISHRYQALIGMKKIIGSIFKGLKKK